eukprot:TRINITY_DN18768_c0_g1_i1.p1 TRINITY_DN18768_c0_g1~~TRINITY_DN18768_c0_g1_i1.p1  ORF type:complete len:421 (+),score=34.80 TRINITY_DN18768_c0_g1_i1:63-1325(+)
MRYVALGVAAALGVGGALMIFFTQSFLNDDLASSTKGLQQKLLSAIESQDTTLQQGLEKFLSANEKMNMRLQNLEMHLSDLAQSMHAQQGNTAHAVRDGAAAITKQQAQLSAALLNAIDYPQPDWLTAVQASRESSMRPVTNMAVYRKEVQRLFKRRPCRPDPSDCELHDALLYVLWGMTGGVLLEMGALDGAVRSTETYDLASSFGFKRILIEADPAMRAFRRQKAPEAVGVSAAVCDTTSEVHYLHHNKTFVQGIGEFMPRPFLQRWHPDVLKALEAAESAGGSWDNVVFPNAKMVSRVSCVPLGLLLSAVGVHTIDFMILDVEGAELPVLRTIDWSSIVISVLVVECTNDRYQTVVDFMTSSATNHSYEALFDRQVGRNVWLVRKGFQVRTAPGRSKRLTCREEQPPQGRHPCNFED